MEEVLNRLKRIEDILEAKQESVNILTVPQTAKFLNISQSHLYRLTSQNAIPHYSPGGKRIYFKRVELEEYLVAKLKCDKGNNTPLVDRKEIDRLSDEYLIKNKR